jgi:tripartite-type tricarboxylate transporter receptor subunit TctC
VPRVIANEMGKLAGQSVVVENKPGAEGQIGAQEPAAPDGGVPADCRATQHGWHAPTLARAVAANGMKG